MKQMTGHQLASIWSPFTVGQCTQWFFKTFIHIPVIYINVHMKNWRLCLKQCHVNDNYQHFCDVYQSLHVGFDINVSFWYKVVYRLIHYFVVLYLPFLIKRKNHFLYTGKYYIVLLWKSQVWETTSTQYNWNSKIK